MTHFDFFPPRNAIFFELKKSLLWKRARFPENPFSKIFLDIFALSKTEPKRSEY